MKLVAVMLGSATAVMLLIAALMMGEALWVGVFASETQIAEYHFGSEPMVGYGGFAYESVTSYVLSGFGRGGGLLAMAFALALGSVRIWRWPKPRDGAALRLR